VGRVRVVENGRVRADFVAGAAGERPFLAEASLTSTGRGFREVTGDGVFSYRFQGLGPDSTVELEIGGSCRVGIARGVDPLPRLRGPGGRSVALGSELPIVLYPLTGARPLVTVGEDAVSWLSPCGAGWLLYCGVSPAFAAGSAEGAECFRDLVRAACEQVRISPVEGPLIVRRGSLVMAHAFGRTARLAGSYLDLLKPGQPLVRNPALPYRLPALFREVRMQGRTPAVIHATHRCRVEESDANRTRLTVEGPEGTRGMICLFAAGQTASALEATAVDGRVVAASLRAEGGLVRVETPLAPRGIMLTLKWSRPEARLTK
jgi:hypothetical protein